MHSISFDTMTEDTEKPNYNLPDLNLMAISNKLQGQNVELPDSKISWKVNFDRLNQDRR